MADRTALILAAGMGVRMGARGKLMPKGIIPVGGRSMILRSLDALEAAGFERIVMVTGHLSEQYEDLLADRKCELIYNPDYATTGSLRSLMTGLSVIDGPCLIVESDLIYAAEALEPMDCQSDIFLVSGPTNAGDEIYVWTRPGADGRPLLKALSKNISEYPGPYIGEMVGLTSLTANGVREIRTVGERALQTRPAEHYEPIVVELAHKIDVHCLLLPNLAWTEIDDEQMLAQAEQTVLPRIEAADRKLRDGAIDHVG